MEIRFFAPGLPVAQPRQRHRVVTAGGRTFASNYTPAKDPVNAFKATIRMAAAQAYSGEPLTGPLRLTVVFVFPRPAALTWKTKPMPADWKTSKPDLDNVEKALKDALTGLTWVDDSQVSAKSTEKIIAAGGQQPGTHVVIRTLESRRN